MSMKNFCDTIRNWTHDLLACSAVPQPAVPLSAPVWRQYIHQKHTEIFYDTTWCHTHHLRMWKLVQLSKCAELCVWFVCQLFCHFLFKNVWLHLDRVSEVIIKGKWDLCMIQGSLSDLLTHVTVICWQFLMIWSHYIPLKCQELLFP